MITVVGTQCNIVVAYCSPVALWSSRLTTPLPNIKLAKMVKIADIPVEHNKVNILCTTSYRHS